MTNDSRWQIGQFVPVVTKGNAEIGFLSEPIIFRVCPDAREGKRSFRRQGQLVIPVELKLADQRR
jgi:hypothetical protein